MVEKNKVKVLNALDDIGCGCGSCDVDRPHTNEHEVKKPIQMVENFDVLDDIGCACGSCETPVIDKDAFDIEDKNDEKKVEESEKKQLTGLFKFLKENSQLVLSFLLFFTALLTKLDELVDLGLYITAYLLVSRGVLQSAVKSIFKGRMLDENFLMSIASLVAFGIGEYAEGVAVMLFYAVGQLTEEYAINRSKRSISSILDLRPDFANIKTPTGIIKVDPSSVKLGEVIVVKPGERVPLDGTILKGTTQIDSAMLTGESLPVEATVDTEVYSGTINISAVIEVKVRRVFADSAVSKILSMVQKANENKAHTEKFITKFAKVYTPIVVISALLIAIVPPLLLGQSFNTWLYRGAIFLVVSCPCALVISVPLGYFGGIGGAARKGILVKGGQFLEVLKKTETIVFDKTGTLTKGNFSVESIDVLGKLSDIDILKYSAHIESLSNHPIAVAIVKSYEGTVDESLVHDVKEIAGKGLMAKFNNQVVCIGNDALMKDQNINLPQHETIGTTLYLSVDGLLEGILHINDEIKEKTIEGLKQLKSLGVKKFVMLTGDRAKIANNVGFKLGIDEIHSELLPEDKLSILETILKTDKNVVFIGDGINDAPVLTRADVGIAMGNLGSDVAIESSDVVLMTDEVTTVADGIRVSRFTSKIIMQNIIFALGVKVLIMILGTMGMATLWMAIFGDVGVAFIAILNSGRAIYSK